LLEDALLPLIFFHSQLIPFFSGRLGKEEWTSEKFTYRQGFSGA
jgi:hypothetical protein